LEQVASSSSTNPDLVPPSNDVCHPSWWHWFLFWVTMLQPFRILAAGATSWLWALPGYQEASRARARGVIYCGALVTRWLGGHGG
jgi:cytosine/uracil/thiamine/allantoin permease